MRLSSDQLLHLMDRISDLTSDAATMERCGEYEEVGVDLGLTFTGGELLKYRVAREILLASGSASPDLLIFLTGINIVLASFESALAEAVEGAEDDERVSLPDLRALPARPVLN